MEELMHLVDLKLPDKSAGDVVATPERIKEQYPHGLRLNLDSEMVKKMNASNLDVEDELTIIASACVTSKSVSEKQDDTQNINIEIQIQSMSFKKKHSKEQALSEPGKGLYQDLIDGMVV
jgi:hypothetical protein